MIGKKKIKLKHNKTIVFLFFIISIISLSNIIPNAYALEVDTEDGEVAYSVTLGNTKKIIWEFSEKPTPDAEISWTIEIDGEKIREGSTNGTRVIYTPSDDLEEGIYYISIKGRCRGSIAYHRVRWTVADPEGVVENIFRQIIPGFEIYVFIGISSLMGSCIIIAYYQKFRKSGKN